MSPSLSICAVIAARNEVPYLWILLPRLHQQNIDVSIVDNESGEESRACTPSWPIDR